MEAFPKRNYAKTRQTRNDADEIKSNKNPKNEKLGTCALDTLSKLLKTSFGKKLNELGFDENDDTFDLNA